jgi:hypothetical protein
MMLNRKGKQILYKHHRRPRTAIYPEIQEYMMLWSLEKKKECPTTSNFNNPFPYSHVRKRTILYVLKYFYIVVLFPCDQIE